MTRLIWVFASAAALAGCNGGGVRGDADPDADATATPTATASPSPSPTATGESPGARSVAEETDDFLFEYAYPVEAGRIPELAALLDRRLDQRRAQLARESAQARAQARDNGFPYNKHSYTAEWKVVANLPGWLSLSNEIATYSGGAHGNATVASLVWDKERAAPLDGAELFTSRAALEQALGSRFCDGLDREREKRRGAPVDPEESGNSFVDCPDISELEVLVGSSNRRTFDRLTLYAGPYVAGPYAEGAYQVNLTVDRAVLDALKPEYREAFTARN